MPLFQPREDYSLLARNTEQSDTSKWRIAPKALPQRFIQFHLCVEHLHPGEIETFTEANFGAYSNIGCITAVRSKIYTTMLILVRTWLDNIVTCELLLSAFSYNDTKTIGTFNIIPFQPPGFFQIPISIDLNPFE